jgi:hypothetical protein
MPAVHNRSGEALDVPLAGVSFGPGETVEVTDAQAETLLASPYFEQVDVPAAPVASAPAVTVPTVTVPAEQPPAPVPAAAAVADAQAEVAKAAADLATAQADPVAVSAPTETSN